MSRLVIRFNFVTGQCLSHQKFFFIESKLAEVWKADTNLVRQAECEFLLHSLHIDAVVGALRAGQRGDHRRQVQSDCLKEKEVGIEIKF